MGDLKSFVTRDYPKYLSYVDDLKFPVKKWSDSRARDMSELLNRLIGKIILNICQKMSFRCLRFDQKTNENFLRISILASKKSLVESKKSIRTLYFFDYLILFRDEGRKISSVFWLKRRHRK